MKTFIPNINDCAVVVLAAGKSQRMGKEKALLKYNSNSIFFEKIIETYIEAGVQNISMVVNPNLYRIISTGFFKNSKKISILVNRSPELGRMYSIQLGIEQHISKHIFIQNIDNPFVSNELIEKLRENYKENHYVSPYYNNKGGHPILLCKNIAEQLLRMPDVSLRIALSNFNKIKLPVDDSSILTNINTPEAYKRNFS